MHNSTGMRALLVAICWAGCAAPAAIPSAPTPPAPTPLALLEAARDLDNIVIGESRTPTVVVVMTSWCVPCRAELDVFERVRVWHPRVRWLALNSKAHEEYDQRGNSIAIRAVADDTPWLRIVPTGDDLFAAFGRPPKIPTVFVYDGAGTLVAKFDRRERRAPSDDELDALLRTLH